jgi:hypothetical protein
MYALPELKVHISHLTRNTEVALKRNETPCGFEELNILEIEGIKLWYLMIAKETCLVRIIDCWIAKN